MEKEGERSIFSFQRQWDGCTCGDALLAGLKAQH